MGELISIGANAPRAAPVHRGVKLAFRLPPALLLGVPIGNWRGSPPDVVVFIAPTGEIWITCRDLSEVYSRRMVLQTATAFLRSLAPRTPTTMMAALVPGNADAPLNYAIVIGAAVSITRSIGREPPTAA